jgi:hypothetical protein
MYAKLINMLAINYSPKLGSYYNIINYYNHKNVINLAYN